MELSPEALREAQFTERFRGYDAAEVDNYLNEVADALEEFVSDAGSAMAEAAATQARLAIEQVRQENLAAVEDLRRQRESLEEAVADLVELLYQRRQQAVDELALIDATLRAGAAAVDPSREDDGIADDAGDHSGGGDPGDTDEAGDEESDTFLARLEEAGAEPEESDASGRRRSKRDFGELSEPD